MGNNDKQLRRTRDGRMIAGVCSGAAKYLNLDPTVVRVGAAVITLFTGGTALLAYVAGVLIIPEEGSETSVAQDLLNKNTKGNDNGQRPEA